MKEIKKIGVMSFAKIEGLLMAIMGLILGIFYAIIGVTAGVAAGSAGLAGLGVLAIIVAPIAYGVMGFVLGAVGSLLYNLVAKWIGGMEIELK